MKTEKVGHNTYYVTLSYTIDLDDLVTVSAAILVGIGKVAQNRSVCSLCMEIQHQISLIRTGRLVSKKTLFLRGRVR